MTITHQDVTRLANLAHITLSDEETHLIQQDLSGMLTLIEQLLAVDTQDVEPLAHPLSLIEDVALRLRDDEADATASAEQRAALMANAPAQTDGLFLVPTVIE